MTGHTDLLDWLYRDQMVTFEERISIGVLGHTEPMEMVRVHLWGRVIFWANEHGYDVNGTRDDQRYSTVADNAFGITYIVEVTVRMTPRRTGQWGHIREQMVALAMSPVLLDDPFERDWENL